MGNSKSDSNSFESDSVLLSNSGKGNKLEEMNRTKENENTI